MNSEDVRKQFIYNDDGTLTRRRTGIMVPGSISSNGYPRVLVNGKARKVHRVVFLIHHGHLPKYIDHIDGDKANNRIENLRECTRSQNQQNTGLLSNNSSGFKGVSWSKRLKKWFVQLRINGESIHLGFFNNKIEAAEAYDRAAIDNYGEFAKTNEMLGLLNKDRK